MKKMRNSKRGFTLTEIIIVVAIIVIVSSAAFVGVAVTLNNAERQRDLVKNTHGQDDDGKELFEAEAWAEIDKWTENAAKFLDIDYYKPHGEEQVEGDLNENPDQNNPSGNNPGGNVETDEERRAREEAERKKAEEEARKKAEEEEARKKAEEEARKKALEEQNGAGGTQTINVLIQSNSSYSITCDESKTIKSITVKWEKTAQANGSFKIGYVQSSGFDYYGNGEGVQTGYDQYSGSYTYKPYANGQQVKCSNIKFTNTSWGDNSVKIVSCTIEYEDN